MGTLGLRWKLTPEQVERRRKRQSGSGNNNYRGGKMKAPGGYVWVNGRSFDLEHRLVMEKAVGRKLLKREVVHHWDENRKNNKLKNLCLMRTRGVHARLHFFARRHGIDVKKLYFPQPWLTS